MSARRVYINPNLLRQLKPFKNRLIKYRSKKHTTNHAIAHAVSKNEAIRLLDKVINSQKLEPSKVRELYARILALGKQKVPTMSPFNPPNGFYIWSVADHGALHLQLLGRNVKETVLNLAHFVLRHSYHVERQQQRYLYILIKKKLPVGKLYFAKAGPHRRECLVAKIGREKILFHYNSKGLFIHISIHCPRSIKTLILPYFQNLEQEFASLCVPSFPSIN